MTDSTPIALERPRSVGEILTATLRLYRRYPLLFAILALGVMAPYELGVLAITGYGPLTQHESVGISYLLLLIETVLITPLISALHMHAVVSIGDGQRPRLGAVALRGVQVLPVVAAAAVMSSIGIFLGYVALIVPGILLGLRWAVVAQAAALEHEGWLGALRSSGRLTHGHYRHVLGLILVAGALAVSVKLGVREIPLGSTSGLTSVAVGIAVDTATASFAALTLAFLYFDLRSRAASALP
jgi:hypothetical protein